MRPGDNNVYIALDRSCFNSGRQVAQAHVVVGRREAAEYRAHGWEVYRILDVDPHLLATLEESTAKVKELLRR